MYLASERDPVCPPAKGGLDLLPLCHGPSTLKAMEASIFLSAAEVRLALPSPIWTSVSLNALISFRSWMFAGLSFGVGGGDACLVT